jgi:hypothetical protein
LATAVIVNATKRSTVSWVDGMSSGHLPSRKIGLLSWFGIVCVGISSCNKPNRIGEHVWVEWEGKPYRAFVIERLGAARFRVQFEGCDAHWQRDVAVDKIVGRLDEVEEARAPVTVACSPAGAASKGGPSGGLATPYKVSDRIRVRWRGSVYTASVVAVVAPDRFLVHYEGHESAWDEVVPLERVEGPR